jgi:redox-sensitive bicupin YhaK (pirin superfamily)
VEAHCLIGVGERVGNGGILAVELIQQPANSPHGGDETGTRVVRDKTAQPLAPAFFAQMASGVEWMQAGRGMWHGGGLASAGRTRGFQLWIALPPALELGPTTSVYQAPGDVPEDGPARILLGTYGAASSSIVSPSPMNYVAVRLKAGERWRYEAPPGHTVLWAAVLSGAVSVPEELRQGELAAFEQSSGAIEFVARADSEFVLGSAVPHKHDLVLGSHSVHTTRAALRDAQAHISALRAQLV